MAKKAILTSAFIPVEPEEITAEWLYEVINQYRHLKEMSLVKEPDDLVSCEIAEKKSSKGRLSSTYLIDIKFKCYTSMGHEQCLMSFFLKLLPSAAITNGDKNRTLARKLRVFPKEVNATFGVLPQVQKFAKNANLTLAIPEIVYGSHDSKGSGVIVLINEDKKGFASVRQYSGLTLPEVTVVIDRISEIHAATAAMFLSKNSENFENKKDFLLKCDENNPENTDENSLATLRQNTDLVLRTLTHFLRRVPGYLEKHQLICKYKHILVEHLMQSNSNTVEPLKCLTHGELYERNVLFKQESNSRSESNSHSSMRQVSVEFNAEDTEDNEADTKASSNVDIDAIITDWKQCRVSSPNSDLAFFFLSSTSQSMRAKYTQDWLEQYYFSFTECLRSKFDIKLANQFSDFDFDVFCKDFKSHIYKAYLQAVLNLTRELRFVENEFHFLKEPQDRERMGYSLKYLGRRLLELVDELVNILETKDWKITNNHLLNKEETTVSATVNLTDF